jgi:hypothetical protein
MRYLAGTLARLPNSILYSLEKIIEPKGIVYCEGCSLSR